MSEIETTVLIVGGGPVGLVGAQLLGRRGVKTLVAEKYPTRLEAPKAHALNPRSLEICEAAGLPMDAIHAVATPTEDGAYVRMVETLSKAPIGAITYERQDAAVRALTPWPLINIEQPRFEEVVEGSIHSLPSVELQRGLEWLECLQIGNSVVSTLRDRTSGETVKVRSRYVIACDGANSAVRDGVGIAMDGPEGLANHMMIHFEANLRPVVKDIPGILYFLFGPGINGVLIAYDIEKTWVLMHPCGPDASEEEFDEARCRAAVLSAVGADVPDLVIKGVRGWMMSAQVARRYRDGQVFLAGDAGHRFPPTGGLGLNTGIADIDNLTWKIATVEAGWASPNLLESYEPERRIIAQTNMGQSLANAFRIRTLFEALGYAPDQTVTADVFHGRLADPAGRATIDEAIAYQKDHFDSLRLQLGYAYSDALAGDQYLPISEFAQKCVEGARLPHIALQNSASTLNLVNPDGFTLITGREGASWHALVPLAGAPLACKVEGADFSVPGTPWSERMGLAATGAVLVRPDGHILAIALTDDAADISRLGQALAGCLHPQLQGTA